MAKVTLGEGGFSIIPEGVYVFKITEVDDSKYENFGKLVVKMQTQKGIKHSEQFSLIKTNGEVNTGGLKAFSYFAKTALNNFDLDNSEIETGDLVGCYIKAEIKHEEFESNKEKGKMLKSARMGNWSVATGFETTAKATATAKKDDSVKETSSDDVDDFLND